MEDIEKKWYVVHTLSGQEYRVKETLQGTIEANGMQEIIPEILIPTENVSEVKGGKKTVTTRKFFPGYILIRMAFTNETWSIIKHTSGVIGFVGSGSPVPLRDSEIEDILQQIEAKKESVKPKISFQKGEGIRIIDGPFANFSGVVDEIYPERGKLKVMSSIFGRLTPVELEYWQVEKE